jgi:hypothetical protein
VPNTFRDLNPFVFMRLAADRSELVEQNHYVIKGEGSRHAHHCAQNVRAAQVPDCKDNKCQDFTAINENLSTYKYL